MIIRVPGRLRSFCTALNWIFVFSTFSADIVLTASVFHAAPVKKKITVSLTTSAKERERESAVFPSFGRDKWVYQIWGVTALSMEYTKQVNPGESYDPLLISIKSTWVTKVRCKWREELQAAEGFSSLGWDRRGLQLNVWKVVWIFYQVSVCGCCFRVDLLFHAAEFVYISGY